MDMGLWELIKYCWEVLFGIFFNFLKFSEGFVMFAIVKKKLCCFIFPQFKHKPNYINLSLKEADLFLDFSIFSYGQINF